jgi:hypothetical protein
MGIKMYEEEKWEEAMGGLMGAAAFGEVMGFSDSVFYFYGGLAAFNIEISVPNPFHEINLPIMNDIYPVIFTDIGSVWESDIPSYNSFKKSFGISFKWFSYYYLDYFFNLEKIQFDLPIWLSHVPNNQKNLEFRWLIRFDFRY